MVFLSACNTTEANKDILRKEELIPHMSTRIYKYGYANSEGKIRIKHQFSYASKFIDTIAIVEKTDNKRVAINKLGEEVFTSRHGNIVDYDGDFFLIQNQDKWGFVNINDSLIFPLTSENLPYRFSESDKYWHNDKCLIAHSGYEIIEKNGRKRKPFDKHEIICVIDGQVYIRNSYGEISSWSLTTYEMRLKWGKYYDIYPLIAWEGKWAVRYKKDGPITILNSQNEVVTSVNSYNELETWIDKLARANRTDYGIYYGVDDYEESLDEEYQIKFNEETGQKIIFGTLYNKHKQVFPPIIERFISYPNQFNLAEVKVKKLKEGDADDATLIYDISKGEFIKSLAKWEALGNFSSDGIATITSSLNYTFTYEIDTLGNEFHDRDEEERLEKKYMYERERKSELNSNSESRGMTESEYYLKLMLEEEAKRKRILENQKRGLEEYYKSMGIDISNF